MQTAMHPDWYPDSTQRAIRNEWKILVYVMKIDGTGLLNITNSPRTDETHPDWR